MVSVIIPNLNEKNHILNKTIKSIQETSDAEIIVIDDHSDFEPIIKNKNITYHRNQFRMGAAQSKHLGATYSTRKYLFLTDSHVLFEKGWYEEVISSLNNKPNVLYCGACLGLSEKNFVLNKYQGIYYGARLFLHEKNEILDGKWTNGLPEDDYEISCVMGANYFMHKNHFFKIRGYSELKAWGSEEPCLSLKTWLSGGEVRLNKKVRTGHMFRDAAPYVTYTRDILYNKIRLIKTLFDEELSNKILSIIPRNQTFQDAMNLIDTDQKKINESIQYYKKIFTKDINWLCKKFSIQMPE